MDKSLKLIPLVACFLIFIHLAFEASQASTNATAVITKETTSSQNEVSQHSKETIIPAFVNFCLVKLFKSEDTGIQYSFGSSISISDDGSSIAIGGSKIVLNQYDGKYQGFIKVFAMNNYELTHDIFTTICDSVPLILVNLSGDGSRLASATICSSNKEQISSVDVYELFPNRFIMIGHFDHAGRAGELLPYLHISLSTNGNALAISGNVDSVNDKGHIMVYMYKDYHWSLTASMKGGPSAAHGSKGASFTSYEGKGVSLTSSGSYFAIGASIHNSKEDGRIVKEDAIRIYGSADPTQIGNTIEVGNNGNNEYLSSFGVTLVELTGSILRVAVGVLSKSADMNGANAYHVKIYDFIIGSSEEWEQVGSDIIRHCTAPIENENVSLKNFGSFQRSITLSRNGQRFAVTHMDDSIESGNKRQTGNVDLFEYDVGYNEKWRRISFDFVNESQPSSSGYSIDISGDGNIVVIGSSAEPLARSGSVTIHDQNRRCIDPIMKSSLQPTIIPNNPPTARPFSFFTSRSFNPSSEVSLEPSLSSAPSPSLVRNTLLQASTNPTFLPPTETLPTSIPSPGPSMNSSPDQPPSGSDVPTTIPQNALTKPSNPPTARPFSFFTSRSFNPSSEVSLEPSSSSTPSPSLVRNTLLQASTNPTFLPPTETLPTSVPSPGPSMNSSPDQPPSGSDVPTTIPQSALPTSLKKKPNILLILADDVGTGDLPRYWNSGLVHMPNINGLSEKGVMFTDAHGTPLCAPSRYMLLSGNYQHRGRHYNGRWNIGYQHNQFQSHQKSIAEVLRDKAGYHTAMFGKWHLGAKVAPNGLQNKTHVLTSNLHNWTLPLIDGPQDIGFSKSYVTTGGIQEAPYSFFRNGLLTTNVASHVSYWEEGKYKMPSGDSIIRRSGEGDIDWDSTAYNQILVNETSQFINDHLEDRSEDPFFAYVALGSVHIPHSPPTKYSDGSPIAGEYPTAHMDLLLELDKVVGSLVSLVERKGIANETIIMFSSDNGGLKWDSNFFHHSSGPLRGSKGQIYEGGHRVPLIIRYDGVYPTNEKRSNLVGLNDIFSTICDIIGIDVPDGSAQDSVSFAHHIRASNNTSGLRSTLSNWDYSKGTLQSEAVRFGHLKFIRHFGAGTGTDELYDLESDLSETKNLIDNVDYADTIIEMASKAKEVGPCPDNVKGPIVFSTGREVTCGYFRTNTQKRCAKWRIEGELYCNKICGRFKTMCRNLRAPSSNKKRLSK